MTEKRLVNNFTMSIWLIRKRTLYHKVSQISKIGNTMHYGQGKYVLLKR